MNTVLQKEKGFGELGSLHYVDLCHVILTRFQK